MGNWIAHYEPFWEKYHQRHQAHVVNGDEQVIETIHRDVVFPKPPEAVW
ncbi:hypothetical protein Poly24_25570 [Rosistilla carotiformis]|uniref:Uncharacterized protein n=1 Tax=Rosistilla carotiformis TaxID=2528017 RepID=A0A518JTH5_9BACT|nr:hypothetical protein [Rosistilla carotiformis]QDV68844.1 hypothetical protein Poly24_25570 [Rosistilla carotiformis]